MAARKRRRSKHLAAAAAKRARAAAALEAEEPPPRMPLSLAAPTTFELYYQAQGFLADEWGPFVAALRRPLPVTFRVSAVASRRSAVVECLERGRPFLHPEESGTTVCDWRGRVVPPPQPLSWAGGWQLGCDKTALRFAEWGSPLHQLKGWLADYTSLGILTRQEVVSMIPAALLNPEPHHLMLDMCASPGSKTTQLLEALHRNPEVEATGAVVANDVDPQRAFHLVRRCAALGEPCTRLMVTCHPGQRYPNPSCVGSPLVHTAPSTTATAVEKEGRYAAGCYDRIICDVPCSGDGTLRKIPEAWKQWHPDYGIKLHSLQLSIALRGLALLRVGGIMCYSTCTFNPIEDEAVVGELLRVCGGAVELMDATTRLPQVKWRSGIKQWKVIDDAMRHYPTYASSQAPDVPAAERRRFRRSMWPPLPPADGGLPLHRCLRLLPQDQDTGGFFVAMLRKVAPLPGPPPRGSAAAVAEHPSLRSRRAAHAPATATSTPSMTSTFHAAPRALPPERQLGRGGHGYIKVPEAALRGVCELLGLTEGFKKDVLPHLFSRSPAFRNVTFMAPAVHAHCLEDAGSHRLKQVFAGIRLLAHDRKTNEYRLVPETLPTVLRHITSQLASLPVADLESLLARPGAAVAVSALSRAAQKEVAKYLRPGACVLTPRFAGEPRVTSGAQLASQSEGEPLALAAALQWSWSSAAAGRELVLLVEFTRARGREHAPRAAAKAMLARIRARAGE